MKYAKSVVFCVLLAVSAAMGFLIIKDSIDNQKRKTDYAEINNVKYGLFSINEWKRQLSDIINAEVKDFDPKENKAALKPLIEKQLLKLIDTVDQRMKKKNKETFKGRMKQAFINAFVDIEDIKAGVPQYAEEIFAIMQKPSTKKTLRNLVADKVENYFERTYEEQDLTPIETIMQKLGVTEMQAAKDILDQQIAATQKRIFHLSWVLIAICCLLFVVAGFSKAALTSAQYIVLALSLLILLVCGVTTPMIDLEAKISEMSFVLLDHPVKFLNQVLYFQTKSVVDVFWLMITDSDIQMQIVGILMVMFSIVFPVSKLIASMLYFYNIAGMQKNKVVHFFVHKSGKWSMTDVMIIAIFMAYIGFNGVIASQFGKMHSADNEIVFLTTNGTSLQAGFYLFMTYAVLALFFSSILEKKNTTSI
ncbi:hypothetical protein AZI86_01065 [Bdellovibrio bacteriovorus]|uniref:Paraquat-inducible protein A n=1 Tax=Bdellovibrio bacteriovorus TaxID=959 RepID=A0A150WMU8_BDEBC|nr:paraquat-inducible protein A [Bdellovibrio bacteriovorus]KYG65696.1 hypothetical protein AZI86_01065 [Bdellovibrio bacteriovorus]